MPRLAGQVAIVTGGGQGIGGATARRLAEEGAKVLIVDHDPKAIETNLATIRAAGGTVESLEGDVGKTETIRRMVDVALERFGKLNLLVNNAMAQTRGRLEEMTPDDWDLSMTTNVRSLFILTRLVLPHMTKSGGGSIINISSGAAEHASNPYLPPGYTVYATAKAAMERFSTAVALEVAEAGVAINALRPGAVKTELATSELGEDYDWSNWLTPASVVPAVLFLAAQREDGLTGRVVDVNNFGTAWP